ncbi:MAG: SpoVG family protein [Bacilli bacterium]|jgi:stage V sporulation protein G|nr:SpoVG family protein [Bacilli bacterium]HOC97401.1 SpoVG family protein [Bacilli bacterium]HQM17851.1 SpoVG family protein [Bacilli bacterium]
MPITNVQVYLVENAGKIKASATITFDDAFVVHGLRIIEGEKGLFVAMPTRYSKAKGRFLDTAHPITNKARSVLVEAILKAYEEELEKSK